MRASTWFHASPAGAALLRKTGEPMPLAFERIGRQRKAVEMGFADNPGPVYFDAAHVQVSERLGHSTVQLTLDRYSHVVDGIHAAAAEQLGAIIFTGRGSTDGAQDG